MHPMAAYCALKGMIPMVPKFATEGVKNYRIRRPDIRGVLGHFPQLSFREVTGDGMPPAGGWQVDGGVAMTSYIEIHWDSMPDATMDLLTQALVDEYAMK